MKVYIVYDTSRNAVERSIRWVFTDKEKAEKEVELGRVLNCNPCLKILEMETAS